MDCWLVDFDRNIMRGYKQMTKTEFITICGELLIDVDIALSDDNVEAMLISREDEELKEYLTTQF